MSYFHSPLCHPYLSEENFYSVSCFFLHCKVWEREKREFRPDESRSIFFLLATSRSQDSTASTQNIDNCKENVLGIGPMRKKKIFEELNNKTIKTFTEHQQAF